MRISPIAGTPTIPNTPQSGNSPEKLARLKAIAAGESPISVTESEDNKEKLKPTMQSIKMNTNRTVNREIEPPVLQQNEENIAETNGNSSDSAISDPSVQANGVKEATQPLSPQFAELQKQRRALQVKERELTEKMKAFEGPSRLDLETRIKSEPLSVLQELGVTYDQLTQEILSAQSGVTPDIQALKAEIKAIKEGVDKTLSEKDTQAEQAVLSQMRRNIQALSAEGDDFELIRETKSHDDVVELIHRTWKESGEVMDELEAMKLIEDDLVNEASKFAKLKKVQGKLTPIEPLQPQPTQSKAISSATTGMRTLTNKDSAQPTMNRRQRAMLAAQGLLPKR